MSRDSDAAERIAEKWAAAFPADHIEEPQEPEAEPAPIGKSSVIPNAGNQPDKIPTEAELLAIAQQAGDTETSTRLKNAQLAKLIEQTHWLHP